MTTNPAAIHCRPSSERALLTLCYKSISNFIHISSKVQTEDILDPGNRALFIVFLSLASLGVEKFDLPSVVSLCNDLGVMKTIGDPEYIYAVASSEVSEENIDVYIEQVLDASALYKLDGVLDRYSGRIRGSKTNVDSKSVLSAIEEDILSISIDTLKTDDGKHISTGLAERLKYYESNPAKIRGISSGFPILDKFISGFRPSTLSIIAGRPKTGKSMLMSVWALHMAIVEKAKVLYIDTEMPFEAVQLRLLSSISKVPINIIESGYYSKRENLRDSIYYAKEILENIGLVHKYMPGFTIEAVVGLARKYKAQKNLDVLFFDYIKMRELKDNFNETQTLGYVASELKDIAGKLEIPVITGVQLGRVAEKMSRVSSGMVGESDRLLRYCDLLMAITKKTSKEISTDGLDCGTRRLQILDHRSGSSLHNGIDLMANYATATLKEAKTQSSESFVEQKELDELCDADVG